jgi:hypothetical protein
MENFDETVNSRERREMLGQSIERSGFTSGVPVLDILHTNGKEVHPVDVITKVMEGEGIMRKYWSNSRYE